MKLKLCVSACVTIMVLCVGMLAISVRSIRPGTFQTMFWSPSNPKITTDLAEFQKAVSDGRGSVRWFNQEDFRLSEMSHSVWMKMNHQTNLQTWIHLGPEKITYAFYHTELQVTVKAVIGYNGLSTYCTLKDLRWENGMVTGTEVVKENALSQALVIGALLGLFFCFVFLSCYAWIKRGNSEDFRYNTYRRAMS